MPKSLVFHVEFTFNLGTFYSVWSTLELITCYGIGKFLKIPDEQAHILTSGLEFGRKASMLRNLVYRSDDPKKREILKLIGSLQNDSKRNVFAHGFMTADSTEVSFIERSRGGDYNAVAHTFDMKSFNLHVDTFVKTTAALEKALGITAENLHTFALAALSANTNSTKSPVPPKARA